MRTKFTFLLLTLLFFFSSCETDKNRIENAKEVVDSFIKNLSFENYEQMYALYPRFKYVLTYWKVGHINIKSITINKHKNITIIGEANGRNLLFELKKIDEKYKIINSKGLSSDFDSEIYNFAKKIGCIKGNSYDVDISQMCANKELEFKNLVNDIKTRIESSVVLENHTVTKNMFAATGNLTYKNYSRFTIPSGVYNLYVHFYDRKNRLVFTSKEILNHDAILHNQSNTINVFETNPKSFRKISVELKLKTTKFIEEIIAFNAKGSKCKYSKNI